MMNRTRKALLGCSAALFVLGFASASAAQQRRFDLPAQDAATAIPAFAVQAGVRISAPVSQLRGVRTPAIHGEMDARKALQRLLAGTGLQIASDDGSVIMLRRAASPPAEAAPVAAAETAVLGELIVTAQKREERLQDVPISIAVLGGRDLDSSTDRNVTDALQKVPGVSISPAVTIGGGASLTVRGVGATSNVFSGSSPIAYYVDGVPFGFIKSAMVPDAGSYDLDRVEVLRGPQGTLYGASALNGVVRVLTNDPDLHNYGLKGRTAAASTDNGEGTYRADAAVNIPLVPGRLAIRASAGYQDIGGYIDRPSQKNINDGSITDLRLKIGAQPSDNLNVVGSVWHSRSHFDDKPASNEKYLFPFDRAVLDPVTTRFNAYNLKLEYDVGGYSIISSTSHIDYASSNLYDLTIFADFLGTLRTNFASEVTSQEILINSPDAGGLIWSAGAFYRQVGDRLVQEAPYLPAAVDFTDDSKSLAVFAQATARFLDGRLELTGGLRYFTDRVAQIENRPSDGGLGRALERDKDDFNALTPKVEVTWRPNDATTLYASYGQGFRSGFNQNANVTLLYPNVPPAKPDKLSNYEVGAKGWLLDRRISYEGAVYYVDWQDTQQTISVPIPGSTTVAQTVTAVLNAVSASGFGAEATLSARVTESLEVGATVSINDIKADADLNDVGGRVISKGDRLNFSPKRTIGGYLEYSRPIGSRGGTFLFSANANYTSKQISQGVGFYSESEDYVLTSASVAYRAAENWKFTAFVDNLFNENRNTAANCCAILQVVTRPRTIGVQLEYQFR